MSLSATQKKQIKWGSIAVLIGIIIIYAIAGIVVIQDGEVGVLIVLGKISDTPRSAGVRWIPRIISTIETWNIKTQEEKETAKVPSSEGLISELEVSLLYNVTDAPHIRKTIGKDYVKPVLIPFLRETIRTVVSGYQVKSLYSEEGRTEISQKMLENLKSDLTERGISVQAVLLRDVTLPPTFLTSIEKKLQAEQKALEKEFELQSARKDKEIEIVRAEGAAKANEIIAKSLTKEYIQYLWVQGLNDGSSEVIYVPTEANLPVLEATRNLRD